MPASTPGTVHYTKDTYPLAVIDRPLVLPAMMGEVAPGVLYAKNSQSDPTFGTITATAEEVEIGARYGITDQFQLALSTPLLAHISASVGGQSSSNTQYWLSDLRAFDLQATFLAVDTAKLDFAGRGDILFDFGDNANTVQEVGLDAIARFMLTPKLAVYTSQNFGQLGDLLGLGFNHFIQFVNNGNGFDSYLTVPAFVGFQATQKFFAGVGTTLAAIGLSGGGSNFIFSDFLELDVQGRYTLTRSTDLSLLLQFPDLENQSSLLGVAAGVAIRF